MGLGVSGFLYSVCRTERLPKQRGEGGRSLSQAAGAGPRGARRAVRGAASRRERAARPRISELAERAGPSLASGELRPRLKRKC